MLHQLRHVLAEQAEWWVGYNDVGLAEQVHALRAAEVAVAFQRPHFDLMGVGHPVAVLVALVFQPHGLLESWWLNRSES